MGIKTNSESKDVSLCNEYRNREWGGEGEKGRHRKLVWTLRRIQVLIIANIYLWVDWGLNKNKNKN